MAPLLRCLPALEKLKLQDADEGTGVNIVKRALEEPARQIARTQATRAPSSLAASANQRMTTSA